MKSHGIAPSVARAQSDECVQTEGGRVDPRFEEWSYTGLRKRQEAAIVAYNPAQVNQQICSIGGQN